MSRWAVLLVGLAACGSDVSFSQEVQPILTAQCLGNGCHSGNFPARALDLRAAVSYREIVNVESRECGVVLVVPGSASRSYLVNTLDGADLCTGRRMPDDEGLSEQDYNTILDWIDDGAPNN